MNILLGINAAGAVRVSEILPLLLPYRSEGDLVEKAWGISLHQQKTARLFKDDVTAQKAAYHGFTHDHEGHGLLAQTILSEGQAVRLMWILRLSRGNWAGGFGHLPMTAICLIWISSK